MSLLFPGATAEELVAREESLTAVVVYSPELETAHQGALDKELKETRKKADRALDALREVNYPTAAEARRAAEHFVAAHAAPGFQLECSVQKDTVRPKRATRGRPKKGEPVEERTVYFIEPELKEDTAAREAAARYHGLFILLTSRTAPTMSAVLTEYRGQHAVESGFRWLKGPAEVAPIFLHNPWRVEALGFVFTLALQVYTLLQWKLRKRLAEEKQTIPGHNRTPTAKPTTLVLLRLFAQITRVELSTPSGPQVHLLGFQPVHAQVLALLELPLSIYQGPPSKIPDPPGGPAE
jgi:transposase